MGDCWEMEVGGERGSMGKLVRSVVAGENCLVLSSEDDKFVCRELEASDSVSRELVFGMYEEAELDELELVLLSMFSRAQFSASSTTSE